MTAETKWTDRGVEYRWSGVMTMEDADHVHDGFAADPRSDRARYRLHDIRDATDSELAEFEATMVGARDAGQSLSTPRLRVAVLAADERFDHLVRAYAEPLKNTSWTVRLFTEESAARAWIGEVL